MEQNSDLVDFERGSTFGGVMTAVVFIGFIYLLVYDVQENIRNRPYTFDVRDKYLSPEKHRDSVVNLGEYQRSSDIVFGFTAILESGAIDE